MLRPAAMPPALVLSFDHRRAVAGVGACILPLTTLRRLDPKNSGIQPQLKIFMGWPLVLSKRLEVVRSIL